MLIQTGIPVNKSSIFESIILLFGKWEENLSESHFYNALYNSIQHGLFMRPQFTANVISKHFTR